MENKPFVFIGFYNKEPFTHEGGKELTIEITPVWDCIWGTLRASREKNILTAEAEVREIFYFLQTQNNNLSVNLSPSPPLSPAAVSHPWLDSSAIS